MLKEFKEFAFKGNMIDMAVGIIIGGAFGTVVKSLVDDVFMPAIGALTPGGIDFSSKYWNLTDTEYESYAAAKEAGAAVIGYGNFFTAFLSFLILAFAVFIVVKKALGAMKKEEAKPDPKPPEPSAEEKLLTEIRDLLKTKA
ncbi:large conductance mechanosensitive channel protein MscL [Haloferula chungangensis]|uniref:Large-conductance mechanosensitive channel n=1 Tax=Haloferula chungangensis TaxID=1048331 RepID=A0ABW2L781_9BACT